MAWEELTAAEKGYIGGFLDGEGCITYCTSPQGNVYARVCFYNTNKEIIDWILESQDKDGRFKPTSMFMKYKNWDFSNKKENSPWITFLCCKILKQYYS